MHAATAVRTRAALAVLLLVCGFAALLSGRGAGPALALPDSGPDLSVRAAVLPDVEALEPPMRPTGRTSDGWTTYRLAEGRVPDRLPPGVGFRGEISWLQGGLVRAARFHVPSALPPAAPLLVSLHGLSTSFPKVEQQQGWTELSVQQGFVLVYGGGHRASWNAGPCCGPAAAGGVDDLSYLDRLLQVAEALRAIDPRRVHLAGFSNGAMLAYRYACGRPGRIAGVLAVAGTHTAPCTPRRATAVLVVHGRQDPTVPLEGLRYSRVLRSPLPPALQAARQWARTGAGVRSVVLPRTQHVWPTRAGHGYDATGEGWRFLRDHPLPAR